jgi:hypothetical protein
VSTPNEYTPEEKARFQEVCKMATHIAVAEATKLGEFLCESSEHGCGMSSAIVVTPPREGMTSKHVGVVFYAGGPFTVEDIKAMRDVWDRIIQDVFQGRKSDLVMRYSNIPGVTPETFTPEQPKQEGTPNDAN